MSETTDGFDLPDLTDMEPAIGRDVAEPAIGPSSDQRSALELAPVFDVPVNIKAVLGKASMDVATLLQLSRGSLIELDRKVGEPIDIYVNNRLVARGELSLVEDKLGVTMTEIIKDGDQGG
jgi:flagellar motor switch protein FliN/FliY